MSLTESSVSVMLPVTEPERARAFYADRLGLPYLGVDEEGGQRFRLAGGGLVLRPGPPGAQSGHTAMSFEVADLRAEIRDLEAAGVLFEDYDTPQLRTVDHVWTGAEEQAAWFQDPDGNMLCLHQPLG